MAESEDDKEFRIGMTGWVMVIISVIFPPFFLVFLLYFWFLCHQEEEAQRNPLPPGIIARSDKPTTPTAVPPSPASAAPEVPFEPH